jgi:5-methyltetrahydropteroyltriglutamate--homocysteine methyltransferase
LELQNSTPPYRADHVGSLLRPSELVAACERLAGDSAAGMGPHHNEELRRLEDRFIRDVIRLQEEIGLRAISDGEFRRRSWWTELFMGWDGVGVIRREAGNMPFRNAAGDHKTGSGATGSVSEIILHGPIRWREGTIVPAYKFVRDHTSRLPKVTIPAPSQLHYYVRGRKGLGSVYPDIDAFWHDVITAFSMEIHALHEAGARYIQFDDVSIPFMCDPAHRAQIESWGENPDELLRSYASVINAVIAKSPKNITFTMHQCRGNREGSWAAEGGYAPVADILFNAIAVKGYFLEFDTHRAGDFSPLRLLPRDKIVVLGLVSTKTPALESTDDLKRRIDAAAKFAPLERLALSPQCGFASTFRGNPLTLEQQVQKLGRVVEVARDIWGPDI